jgi:glycosyltransferase involved in cell wall biosynthesis
VASSIASAVPPLVSVILPTFNRLQYLRIAVESVLHQTHGNWELLIADDGSDEPTRRYLHALGCRPRISVIGLPHTGIPAVVRNRALQKATGDYVAFLDSDDFWSPRKLQLQLETLRSRTECRWSYTAFTNVDANGVALADEPRRRWMPCEGAVFDRILRGEVSIRTPSVLAERGLLIETGAFDESMRSAEDYDLWLRMALRSDVALLDQPLVCIRHHGENHSGEWTSAYAGQDHTFMKLQSGVDQERRLALRRARTRNALRLASQHAVLRNRIHALRALAGSLGFSWHYAEWWARASKVMLRTCLPEWVLAGNRRRQGRANFKGPA